MKRYGVRLSAPARAHSSKHAAAGLLLWARRTGDIGLLQQRLANAGSATLSAYGLAETLCPLTLGVTT